MNFPKSNEFDYIQFLIAAQKTFSCTEAARVQPGNGAKPAHDSLTRLLHRYEPETNALWNESKPFIDSHQGVLILDDSTLDKHYAKKIELVTRHWSGKHHKVVQGINLLTLLWSEGESHIPCDYRVYDKTNDGKGKNDHFSDLLHQAKQRGFQPEYILFDSWYSSLDNLKLIRSFKWHWLTRLKSNRHVNPDRTGNIPVSEVNISEQGTRIHLKGYGFIKPTWRH